MRTEQFAYRECAYGWMRVGHHDGQITSIKFALPPDQSIGLHNNLTEETFRQLEEYFRKERTIFDLPLHTSGTPFQQLVWKQLCAIPYGETRSYKQIAEAIGNPKASRAVGMANNRNPISIVVPCHRVIGANGSLVGYAGGLDRKKALLALERK